MTDSLNYYFVREFSSFYIQFSGYIKPETISASRYPQFAPLAQLVEQLTLNQWVPGSNP